MCGGYWKMLTSIWPAVSHGRARISILQIKNFEFVDASCRLSSSLYIQGGASPISWPVFLSLNRVELTSVVDVVMVSIPVRCGCVPPLDAVLYACRLRMYVLLLQSGL